MGKLLRRVRGCRGLVGDGASAGCGDGGQEV